MTISPQGAAIICAEDAWQDFCKQQNIKDPFATKPMDCKEIVINGVPMIQLYSDELVGIMATPQELDRYNDLHDKFVSAYVLKLEGFDALSKTHLKNMRNLFRPCDGADHQCNTECKYYGKMLFNCPLEGAYTDEFKTIFEFIDKDLEEDDK